MKRVIVKAVHGAFGYVMEHYYPFGMAAEAAEQGALTDTYAVISIQDSHTGGFGVQFTENQFCKGVLTLIFDDIVTEVDSAVLFSDEMADEVLDFIEEHKAFGNYYCFVKSNATERFAPYIDKREKNELLMKVYDLAFLKLITLLPPSRKNRQQKPKESPDCCRMLKRHYVVSAFAHRPSGL